MRVGVLGVSNRRVGAEIVRAVRRTGLDGGWVGMVPTPTRHHTLALRAPAPLPHPPHSHATTAPCSTAGLAASTGVWEQRLHDGRHAPRIRTFPAAPTPASALHCRGVPNGVLGILSRHLGAEIGVHTPRCTFDSRRATCPPTFVVAGGWWRVGVVARDHTHGRRRGHDPRLCSGGGGCTGILQPTGP